MKAFLVLPVPMTAGQFFWFGIKEIKFEEEKLRKLILYLLNALAKEKITGARCRK